MSSFLTKEQLDKYVKDLASKSTKTTTLKNTTRSKSPPLSKVTPNSPLSSQTTSPSSISSINSERKVGVQYGPRSPPPSNRNSLTSPRALAFNINNNNNGNENDSKNISNSQLNEITTTTTATTTTATINNDDSSTVSTSSIPSNILNSNDSSDDKEKNSKYKNIDDIVNDLSYPMETKLSFKPTTTTSSTTTTTTAATTTSTSPKLKGNNTVPPPKGADDPTKGSYVLSAAFRSSYSAASRTPSVKKPVTSPKQEQREIASNKNQRDSTIQELQNRSDTNWKARYDEAQQKYPPLDKLDKEYNEINSPSPPSPPQNKNNLTSGEQNKNNIIESDSSAKKNIGKSFHSSLDCAGCGKSIFGNVLSAMGKKWHPDHFICKKCGITLEHVSFFEKDGNPYCHLDFHELFSPKCGHCKTPIEGQVINALGKSWHPEHFFCRECGNLFEGGFMVHDGFPYCEKDWAKLFAPKCKGCKETIKGEFMSALDGMWHRKCFVCMTCKEPFDSSYHYVFEGNPYCDKHYKELLL